MPKLDGIIALDKPAGITSAKALYRVRSITSQRKSGHAGTLDPGASGVLVLCLGRATKLVEAIMDQPKVYRATARLDVVSESHDIDRPLKPVADASIPSVDTVEDALRSFEGDILQIPPQISAVKVGGVPAYKRMRHEPPTPLRPRSVVVYWLHLHRYQWPVLDFEMCCGRGAYVRSLIRDLGERLNTGGCLTALVRTRVGPLRREEAWSFSDLEKAMGTMEPVEEPVREGGCAGRHRATGNRSEPPFLISMERARELLASPMTAVPVRPDESTLR